MFHQDRNSGFSLIEVLIAVVVLAVGMLALTSLQMATTRTAADARIRSDAATIADAAIEDARNQLASGASYVALTSSGSFNAGGDCTTAFVPAAGVTSAQAFKVDFFRCTRVQRFVFSPAATTFAFNASTTGNVTQGVPEFKRITSIVEWIDLQGQRQSIQAVDTISSKIDGTASSLISTNLPGTAVTTNPTVVLPRPTGAGIIPIAVDPGGSGDRYTAATNPKPVVENKTGTSSTRFDVLTYQGNTSNVTVQRKIETQVVSCKCQYAASDARSNFFSTKLRPTYWDGTRYTAPKRPDADGIDPVTDIPISLPAGTEPVYVVKVKNGNPTQYYYELEDVSLFQSPQCDVCCRDHYDPSSSAGKTQFDPFLPAGVTHDHYEYAWKPPSGWESNTSQATARPLNVNESAPPIGVQVRSADKLTPGTAGKIYGESCRLIRVDGVWQVATDLRQEHMSLIATSSTDPKWAPTTAATTNYQGFVADFIYNRIRKSGTPPTAEGTPLSDATITSLEDGQSLNLPTSIDLKTSAATTEFLHARGLYIDKLEPAAVLYLNKRLETCGTTKDEQLACILPFLPFVSVNVTELADWSPTGPIKVTSGSGTFGADGAEPLRGKVRVDCPQSGSCDSLLDTTTSATGNVSMRRSNSALVFFPGIDPQDAAASPTYDAEKRTDAQTYKLVASGDGPGTGTPFSFNVNVYFPANVSLASNPPAVDLGSSGSNCQESNAQATKPNPYGCTNATSPTTVRVSKYNAIVQEGTVSGNFCGNNETIAKMVCKNYELSEVKLNGTGIAFTPTVVDDGKITDANPKPISLETTAVQLLGLAAGNTVELNFTLQSQTFLHQKGVDVGYTCGNNNKVSKFIQTCP